MIDITEETLNEIIKNLYQSLESNDEKALAYYDRLRRLAVDTEDPRIIDVLSAISDKNKNREDIINYLKDYLNKDKSIENNGGQSNSISLSYNNPSVPKVHGYSNDDSSEGGFENIMLLSIIMITLVIVAVVLIMLFK